AGASAAGEAGLRDGEPAGGRVAHVLFGVRRRGEELVFAQGQIRARQKRPETVLRDLGQVLLAVDRNLHQGARRRASGDHWPALVDHGAVRRRFDGRRRRDGVGDGEVDGRGRQRDVAGRVGRPCGDVVIAEREGGGGPAAEGSGRGRGRRAQRLAARR